MAEDGQAVAEPLVDVIESLVANLRVEDVRFPRHFVYIAGSVLAWMAFWELADQNQHNPHTQIMTWVFVLIAVWLAYTL